MAVYEVTYRMTVPDQWCDFGPRSMSAMADGLAMELSADRPWWRTGTTPAVEWIGTVEVPA